MTRVKICGLTRLEDARAAAAAGADAIGLVFVPASPRHVAVDQARAICRALPPFVCRVGLFMNASAGQVQSVLEQVPLDWLQFHGDEEAGFCARFGRPWIRAIAMGQGVEVEPDRFGLADALLLDSHGDGRMGGSGQAFDWRLVPQMSRPWILAGGLNPGNVADACRRLGPDAVDVSSGVEVRPGIKSDKLVTAFIQAVKHG